jgi:hypothetical protein
MSFARQRVVKFVHTRVFEPFTEFECALLSTELRVASSAIRLTEAGTGNLTRIESGGVRLTNCVSSYVCSSYQLFSHPCQCLRRLQETSILLLFARRWLRSV